MGLCLIINRGSFQFQEAQRSYYQVAKMHEIVTVQFNLIVRNCVKLAQWRKL